MSENQAQLAWRAFLPTDTDWLADHGRKMGPGLGAQAIERLVIAIAALQAERDKLEADLAEMTGRNILNRNAVAAQKAKLTALVERLSQYVRKDGSTLLTVNGVNFGDALRQAIAHHSAPVGEDAGDETAHLLSSPKNAARLAEATTPTSAPVEDVGGPDAWLIREIKNGRCSVLAGHVFKREEAARAAALRLTNGWRLCQAFPVVSAAMVQPQGAAEAFERARHVATMLHTNARVLRGEKGVKAWSGDFVEREYQAIMEEPNRALIQAEGEERPNKPEGRAYMREVVEAIGFEPDSHHNAEACPYCNPNGLAFAKPQDKDELTDLISEAITDSIDMDWSSRDGARAVVTALMKENIVRIKP